MTESILQGLREIGVVDALDVALVAILVYAVIVWMRQARAGLAFVGIVILGGVYVVARSIGMQLTAWLFQGFFAIFVVILVVIFQEELRRLFERIAVLGLRRHRAGPPTGGAADALARSVVELARGRIGALLVLPGSDPLERHLEGGVDLDGLVSEPLLFSLFDVHSPGHDGAVLLDDGRVRRFSVQLPLSRDFSQLAARGTRHAAGLGLAERTDALCLVVSEERGTISAARDGVLRELATFEDVRSELDAFHRDKAPAPERRRARVLRGLRQRLPEKAVALGLALAMWLVFVPGSQTAEQTVQIPVVVENLPSGYELDKVEPPTVEVTLSGPRRQFFVMDRGALAAKVDGILVELGRRSFELSDQSVRHPKGLTLVDVVPRRVKISVKRVAAVGEGANGGANAGANGGAEESGAAPAPPRS